MKKLPFLLLCAGMAMPAASAASMHGYLGAGTNALQYTYATYDSTFGHRLEPDEAGYVAGITKGDDSGYTEHAFTLFDGFDLVGATYWGRHGVTYKAGLDFFSYEHRDYTDIDEVQSQNEWMIHLAVGYSYLPYQKDRWTFAVNGGFDFSLWLDKDDINRLWTDSDILKLNFLLAGEARYAIADHWALRSGAELALPIICWGHDNNVDYELGLWNVTKGLRLSIPLALVWTY